MELTTTQFQEVVMSVRADDIAEACASFLGATNDLDMDVVIYDAILNQLPEYVDEDGYVDNQTALIDAVKVHLKSRVQSLTA